MGLKDVLAFNHLIKKFSGDVSDTFDYGFKCVNISDYEMTLTYNAKSKVLDSVFNQVGLLLSRMRGDMAALRASNPNVVEKFEVPEEMLNRVHTAVQKNIRQVSSEVKKDGVEILRSKVEKCVFDRQDGDRLHITVKVVGQYVFKNRN